MSFILEDFAESLDNPFEFGKSKIVGVGESRRFIRSIGSRSGRMQYKNKNRFNQDLSGYKEDIKEALKKGAKLLSYQTEIKEMSRNKIIGITGP